MHQAERLHFQSLPAASQHETLWRLALSGLSIDEVADRTGWAPDRIRRTINPEPARAVAPWRASRREPAEARV